MMKLIKKFIAIMLTFVFVLSLVPFSVMAEVGSDLKVEKIYFTNYSYTRHSGNSYLNNPGTYGINGQTHDIRFGGQYFGYVQLDLTGYEEILANENTSIKVSVYCGPYTTTQRKCGDFKAYLVNDKADTSYVAKVTTKKQADGLNMHDTTRPVLFAKSDGTVINSKAIELEANLDNLVTSLKEGDDNSLVTLYLVPSGADGDSGYLSPSYINPKISYLEISYYENEIENQEYLDTAIDGITWEDLSSDSATFVENDLPTFYKGASISWSADEDIISADGKINPPLGVETATTLTATFNYKGATATADFDVTIAPEQPVEIRIPFSNYAFSRDSATNISDPKNHVYKYDTYSGFDCIQTGGSFDGYVQLDLKGYEEILNDPSTTAIVSLEAGYQYSSSSKINPIRGHIVPDSADGYNNETITWNIAQKLGIHNTNNPVLFTTTQTNVPSGSYTSANADVNALAEAIKKSSDSIVTVYLAPVSGDSKIRISSQNSGLFISYYESQIDEESYFADIEESFAWEEITTDSQNALVSKLPTYYKGADIVWSSAEGAVTSSGELVVTDGEITEDTITANVSYKGQTFTREFTVNVCDGKITLGAPSLVVDGGKATASISITNGTDKDATYNLYIVVYNGDEMVALVPANEFVVEKGTAAQKVLTCENIADGSKVKFLVWEADNITPATVNIEK